MGKRIKKQTVKSDLRKDWLRRFEEGEESEKAIAVKDGYDIRTVRKQIDLAKQEREVREARSMVLRSAMEKHYADLRRFAEMLDAQVLGKKFDDMPDAEFLKDALRQHLPRSPIWAYLNKLQAAQEESDRLLGKIEAMVSNAITSNSQLISIIKLNPTSAVKSAITSFRNQAIGWAQGKDMYPLRDEINIKEADKGLIYLRYGNSPLTKLKSAEAETIKKQLVDIVDTMELDLHQSQEYQEFEKTTANIKILKRKLREELAVIRLKHIISGRCKYCPL